MKTGFGYSMVGVVAALLASSGMAASHTVSSLGALMEFASRSGNEITMAPGTYSAKDYLTPEMLAAVGKGVDRGNGSRPPVPVLVFSGNDNVFNLDGVVLEVDTSIYDHLPTFGYHRFLFVSGNGNRIKGLTMRYVGPQQGTNGNALSLWGDHNTLEGVTLFMHGSSPYGYGDLLGKGKNPGMAPLGKQSGLMIGGDHCTLERCKVISRAFGHCFYIQGARNTLVQDCYAEGITRATSDMLRDTTGMAADFEFRSVYENRDGRYLITPGYRKSLTEDGFRTYSKGGPRNQTTGKTTLINCTAINTRAGFEIVGPADGEKTELIGCTALGTERGYLLINGNIVTRRCRGNTVHGPLLYLWRGSNADVELEWTGEGSDYTVHALATISGSNHRVKLTRWAAEGVAPRLPILLGYGMPMHAEMATPILPEEATNITLINHVGMPVVRSEKALP
ncbi:hypothetical protein PDESU_00337 [Pontiella desulfatans]|uniref:Right handed beta helix domain-containing protein n=1 Tax=Pontiella desulfatans TaxID=2750659 RepID=A0A6C2TWU9_PONDE|nr:hypothetical protein PDESU_00337 [Pontiella desulfatans]